MWLWMVNEVVIMSIDFFLLLLWSTKNPEKDNIGKDNQLGLRHVELLGLCSVEFHVGLAVHIGAEHACDDRKKFTGRDSFRRVKCVLENFTGWDGESWLGRIFKHGPVLGLMPWIAMASSKKIPKLLLTFLKLKNLAFSLKSLLLFFHIKQHPNI